MHALHILTYTRECYDWLTHACNTFVIVSNLFEGIILTSWSLLLNYTLVIMLLFKIVRLSLHFQDIGIGHIKFLFQTVCRIICAIDLTSGDNTFIICAYLYFLWLFHNFRRNERIYILAYCYHRCVRTRVWPCARTRVWPCARMSRWWTKGKRLE